MNRNSILDTVKQRLKIRLDDDSFDMELIILINGELSKLAQIGVGPRSGIEIVDNSTEWSELIGTDKRLNFVKEYVCISIILSWDYPMSGGMGEALKDKKAEYEWRLNFEVDPFKLDVIPSDTTDNMSQSDVEDIKDSFDITGDGGDSEHGELTEQEMDDIKDSFDISGD